MQSQLATNSKKYVAKEEVKEIYAAMKVGAEVLDTTNNAITFLSKPKVKEAMAKVSPDLAEIVGKVTCIAGRGIRSCWNCSWQRS